MTPSFIARKLSQLLWRADVSRGPNTCKLSVERDKLVESPDAILHALNNSLEVLVTALGEGVKVDAGRVARITRRKVNGTGTVPAVCFEN